MNHFKDEAGNVFGYTDEQVAAGYGSDMTPITEQERDDLLAPTQAELDAQRVNDIDARLERIDIESVRPLRAISNGADTQTDHDKLASLDNEAETLRAERSTLV